MALFKEQLEDFFLFVLAASTTGQELDPAVEQDLVFGRLLVGYRLMEPPTISELLLLSCSQFTIIACLIKLVLGQATLTVLHVERFEEHIDESVADNPAYNWRKHAHEEARGATNVSEESQDVVGVNLGHLERGRQGYADREHGLLRVDVLAKSTIVVLASHHILSDDVDVCQCDLLRIRVEDYPKQVLNLVFVLHDLSNDALGVAEIEALFNELDKGLDDIPVVDLFHVFIDEALRGQDHDRLVLHVLENFLV